MVNGDCMFDWWFYLSLCAAGALGQLVHSGIGIAKALQADQEISMKRWAGTMILGVVVGSGIGLLTNDMRNAFMAGYAGVDALEGLFSLKGGGK